MSNINKKKSSVSYSPKQVNSIAKAYAREFFISFEDIAVRLNVSSNMVSNLIYRAIAENIASDETAELIYQKLVKKSHYRKNRWEQAFDERIAVKAAKRERIKELKNMIDNYDDSCYQDIFLKEELESELKQLLSEPI